MSQRTADGLTPQQDRFVQEYLVDLNGQQAAVRAGYAAKSARITASRLLAVANVAKAIEAGKSRRAERTEITQDRVLRELSSLAFSDVTLYRVDDQGNLAPAEGAPPDVMKAVSSVKRRTIVTGQGEAQQVRYEVEFRLWDKPGTLKLAGRHVGLFPDQMNVKLGVSEELAGYLLASAKHLNESGVGTKDKGE